MGQLSMKWRVGVFAAWCVGILSACSCNPTAPQADDTAGTEEGSDTSPVEEPETEDDGEESGGCVDVEDTDLDTGSTGDDDTDLDTGATGDDDTGATPTEVDLSSCPDEMVVVTRESDGGDESSFCIDRYEASRADADGTSGGSDSSMALSRADVIPWYENPMSAEVFSRFEEACGAAGKRLCTAEEWSTACVGPDDALYVFGDTYDAEVCNCVDTHCDDYCEENGISSDECNLGSNCGYRCGAGNETTECFHVTPTGSFPGCTNALGTFDINGNVWEIVTSESDARGFEVRGGAFNCASASTRLKCSYNADWDGLYAGFRCCRDITD